MWELSDIDRDGMLDRDEFSVVRNWLSSKEKKIINPKEIIAGLFEVVIFTSLIDICKSHVKVI